MPILNEKKINLPDVTLFAVACVRVGETIDALKQSMKGINYGEIILFTHENHNLDELGIKVIKINKLDYKGYNQFVAYKLGDYIKTAFGLLVQNDGYVLRPDKWDPEFLRYDYIGAPWPADAHLTAEGVNVRVGNGGFSLRSRKLMTALQKLKLPFTDRKTGYFHEDGLICNYYRKALEEYGIKYAPVEVASRFSRESDCHDSKPYTFGFHNRKVPFFFFVRPLLRKVNLDI